jgi:outer membrane protein assembly factor BamB
MATVLVATLALAACWPVPGQNADRTSHNAFETGLTAATVGRLTEAWISDLPQFGLAAADPVVSTGGVHVALGGCALATVRPSDGALVWAIPNDTCVGLGTGVVTAFSPPYVVADDDGGDVIASWAGVFDASPSPPAPEYLGGTTRVDVATATADGPNPVGFIHAVRGDSAITSISRDEVVTAPPPLPPVQIHVQVSYTVVGSLSDAAARRTLKTPWPSLSTLGVGVFFEPGYGTLATAPGDPTEGSAVRAYSVSEPGPTCGPSTRPVECPQWATPIDGGGTRVVIAPDQATIYTGTSAGTVYALDAATGAVLWTAPVGAAVTATPALADGVLYAPTADGRLVALAAAGCDAATCGPLWEASTGSRIGVQPAVAGGVVYTGSDDGSVDAFPGAGCGQPTCVALWSAETGSRITGAPVVSNGRLFVGTAAGLVIAYARA